MVLRCETLPCQSEPLTVADDRDPKCLHKGFKAINTRYLLLGGCPLFLLTNGLRPPVPLTDCSNADGETREGD